MDLQKSLFTGMVGGSSRIGNGNICRCHQPGIPPSAAASIASLMALILSLQDRSSSDKLGLEVMVYGYCVFCAKFTGGPWYGHRVPMKYCPHSRPGGDGRALLNMGIDIRKVTESSVGWHFSKM